ncbi:helix-turn-helix transcriptional regulator [Planctomycetota bacterium]
MMIDTGICWQTGVKMLLTARQLGALLGVGKSTIWSWHASGKVPRPVCIGKRCTRWNAEEVQQWIDSGCPPRGKWEIIKKTV